MSRVAPIPLVCACESHEPSPWHCACGAWKPSGLAECELCSGEPVPVEPKQSCAQLSAAQVQYIRQAVREGVLQVDLAEEFGVRRQTISNVVCRVTWKDVA